MGRLFWKFFFFVLLAQVTTILGIGVAVAVKEFSRARQTAEFSQFAIGPEAAWHVGAAAATLNRAGVAALRDLLGDSPGLPIYALDETGEDLLGREISDALRERARAIGGERLLPPSVRAVQAPDGRRYLLFMAAPAGGTATPSAGAPRFRPGTPGGVGFLPVGPMILALTGSLLFAGLLAWYFAKPIRHLRAAFDSAAKGNLDVRLAPVLGRRRDELSDLGREFDRMADRLRELMDGQRRLLHQVSHEVRSPLARLQAAIGLARQSPDKVDAMIERIEREADRIDRLVGELLTLSRLEAGLAEMREEEVDLGNLLADIVDDARFEATAGTVNVEFVGQGRVVTVGDGELLHRAFENVVRNAMRYSPRHGRVVIELGQAGGRAHVAIEDQGPGVPDGQLDAIFRPFFRAENGKHSDAAGGHGLGLAIAQQVVVAHRGSIRARNRPDGQHGVERSGGLCVEIDLPAKTAGA